MTYALGLSGVLLFGVGIFASQVATARTDDAAERSAFGLADLAAYRSALAVRRNSKSPLEADQPHIVTFKTLWNRPDAFRGRRVTVRGRVERIFRQGPVGSFPPLSEIWITSSAGDPFCLVTPQAQDAKSGDASEHSFGTGIRRHDAIPPRGSTVSFTGTFLRLIRYAATDGARLAPLIVGPEPPFRDAKVQPESGGQIDLISPGSVGISPATFIAMVAISIVVATMLLWRITNVVRAQRAVRRRRRNERSLRIADPPLEFIERSSEL